MKTTEEIINDIRERIAFNRAEIERLKFDQYKLQSMLEVCEKDQSEDPRIYNKAEAAIKRGLSSFDAPIQGSFKTETKLKKSFGTQIIEILKENNVPMVSRDLMNKYNKASGKSLERKNFVSRLSIESGTKKTIFIQEFKELSNDKRFWWGLSEWFDEKKTRMKEEYIKKIMANEKQLILNT